MQKDPLFKKERKSDWHQTSQQKYTKQFNNGAIFFFLQKLKE